MTGWTWLSPNGVSHWQPETGPCATCGKRHEHRNRAEVIERLFNRKPRKFRGIQAPRNEDQT